jgi:hypothetical protein
MSHLHGQQSAMPPDKRAGVVRLTVSNVPSYLQLEEFRGQFSNCEGIVNALVDKDGDG